MNSLLGIVIVTAKLFFWTTNLYGQSTSTQDSTLFVDSLLSDSHLTPGQQLIRCRVALLTSLRISYKKGEVGAYQQLAMTNLRFNNYQESFLLTAKAMTLAESMKDSSMLAKCHRLFGHAYQQSGNDAAAYDNYVLAHNYSENDVASQALCSVEIIDVLLRLNSLESARLWLAKLVQYFTRMANDDIYRFSRASYYNLYGTLLLRNDSLMKARRCLFRGGQISNNSSSQELRRLTIQIERNLSRVAWKGGDELSSMEHLNYALRKAKVWADWSVQRELYGELAERFHERKDVENALKFYSRYHAMEKKESAWDSLTIRARVRNDTAAILALGDDDKGSVGLNKHRWQIFGIISFSFLLILLFGRYIDVANRKKHTLLTQLDRLESKALKAQMNPHFIFNSLNSIQSLIANDNQSEAMLYVSKFSKLLRSVIENSNKNLIPLQAELNNLKFYIELESLRLNFTLDYSIDIDSQISPESEMIPPLIVQPIVENSLWHGLNGKNGIKQLRVRVDADARFLRFVVIDNGIGRDAARQTARKASTGVGLSNTERRISLLNENMVKDSFWIEDLVSQDGVPLGTKVVFKVRRLV